MARPVQALLAVVIIGAAAAAFFLVPSDDQKTPPRIPSVEEGSAGGPEVIRVPIEPRELAKIDIAGRVTDDAGTGHPGATVLCQRFGDAGTRQFDEVGSRKSGPGGEFDFAGLPPGRYRFRASLEGYAGSDQTIVIAEGVTPPRVDLVLTSGSIIAGIVLDPLGNPLPNAEVFAFDERGTEDDSVQERLLRLMDFDEMRTETGILAVTRDDGTYRIDGLEEKNYRIRVRGGGHAVQERRYVPAGSLEVNFSLPVAGRFEVTVTTTDRTPISGAQLELRRYSSDPDVIERVQSRALPPLAEGQSDASGKVVFDTVGGVDPYFLGVQAPGHQPAEIGPIVVSVGESVEQEIQLETGFLIHGVVEDPNGAPLAGARCRAQRSASAGADPSMALHVPALVTGPDGSFQFDTLAMVPHVLLIYHDEFASYVGRDLLPSETPVAARLGFGAGINGRILDATTEEPIAGAIIACPDSGGQERTAVSNAAGEYELRGITPNRVSQAFLSVKKEGYEPQAGNKFTVVEGSTTSGQDLLLRRNGSVRGIVVDFKDRPIGNVMILARRPNRATGGVATVARVTRSAEDGTFFIEDVMPGEKTILEGTHHHYVDSLGDPFTVEPDTETSGLVLRMKTGGDLRGRVVDTEGLPIAGATVGARGDLLSVTDPQYLPIHTISEEDGTFSLRRLPAGEAVLLATAPGYLTTQITGLEVYEGEIVTDVVVQMSTGAKISGFVRDTRGGPIEGATVLVIDTSFGLQKFTETTGEDGAFSFNELGPYPVAVEAVAKSHGKVRLNEQAVNQDELVIVLEPFGAIRGWVKTSNSEPLPTYNVSPRFVDASGRANPRVPSRSFQSDTFDFGGLVPGTYEILIGSAGYAPVVLENIVVRPSRFTELPVATFDPGGKIEGVVYEKATGNALPGAKITVVGGDDNFHHDGTTGPATRTNRRSQIPVAEDGSFEVKGLYYDTVVLKIEHRGMITETIEVNVGVLDLGIAMLEGGAVEGTVNGPQSQILPAQQVLLTSDKGDITRTATTNRKGRYQFTGLPPGTYKIEVTNRSRDELEKGGLGKIHTYSATIIPGETVTVDLYFD